ncbi:RHS repeat domain-containing protein [Terriglobus albidus]|uniref:RHS repeat domain-containing protein n=1 Tax=Terriglobus albidus TaxID=1592106 RepID=UPI0021DF71B3|nr:RHS repeat-associated core domain-containing protein [Terriglobus albidus]
MKTTATMQYDAQGRLNSLIYDDGKTPTKIYSYDQATGWGGTNLGSSKGTLTNAHASIGAIWMESEFLYDSASRISIIGQCLPDWCGNSAHDVWRAYSYDLASRLTQESYTTSVGYFPVRYGYNLAGQLTSVNGGQNDSTHADLIYSAATANPFGISTFDFGNGLKGNNHFESSGRVSGTYICAGSYSVDCAGGSSELYGFSSGPVGAQVNWRCDTIEGNCLDYTYDEFGRLKHSSSSGTSISDYSYDRYGNRWQQTSYNGGLTTALSFNTANNQINSSGYVYDAAGNLTQDPNHSYQYDDDGKLLSVDGGATASYIYDAFNQRVKFADVRGIYRCGFDLFSRLATIWYDNGTTALSQYYAGDSPIAYWLAMDGHIHYQHQDLVGTERVRTNNSGTGAEAQFQSAEFGDNYTTPSADTNLPHFAGTDHDLGQGNFTLEHAVFREYAPSYGRWMSPDPYDGSYNIFDPQSFNRYSYVRNNPLAAVDPLGLKTSWRCEPVGFSPNPNSPGPVTYEVQCTFSYDMDPSTDSPLAAPPDTLPDTGGMWFGGATALGGNGMGTGGAPSNGFNKQAYNTCLNKFNQTSVGKVVNFFSLASPLLGPERLHSAIGDVGGSALKYGAYTGLRYLENNSTQVITALGSGLVADIMHYAVADVVAPVAAVSTGVQVGVHAACAAYSTPSLQPYLPPTF